MSAFSNRQSIKDMNDQINDASSGDTILASIDAEIASLSSSNDGKGQAFVDKALEDSADNVKAMKRRALGARNTLTKTIKPDPVFDSNASLARDWLTASKADEEAESEGIIQALSDKIAAQSAALITAESSMDENFLRTGRLDNVSTLTQDPDSIRTDAERIEDSQYLSGSGVGIEDRIFAPEPTTEGEGLMSRPTKDNVDAIDAYKAEVKKVTQAQTILTDLGFKPNGVDGKLGGGTRRAIRKFQKANGLGVTGQLDLGTVEKINSGNVVEYPDPPKPNAVVEDILPADFDIFTVEIAKIESSDRYDVMGGANSHYVGRYQMGKDALKDVGRGYNDKLNKALLNNPKEQDKLFKAYTTKNHKHLTKNSQAYRDMSPQEKLGILGYAHNQGATAAEEYLYTGVSGKDANGTKGTKYKDALATAFEGILSKSKRPRARPTGLGN